MKRNLFSLAAVVLAVAFSSYTAAHKLNSYAVIGETSNTWQVIAGPSEVCGNGDTKPCDITIDPSFVSPGMEILKTDLYDHGVVLSRQGEF